MDLTVGNVEDDNKFAFLLGSALRNEDAEQVLAVYDNLIPKRISELRLKKIKESARLISELPEHEFDKLVINARSFSLAPGRSSMSQASWSSATQDDGDDKSELRSPDLCNSFTKHNRSYQDEDSGLDSCKLSESFLPDSAEEEQSGLFENVNCNSRKEHVRITSTCDPFFDEEIKVDSSTGGSSIESPRSETSATQDDYSLQEDGIEMDLRSFKETPLPKQSHYNHEKDYWDYMPTRTAHRVDDDEQDNDYSKKKTPEHVDKSIFIPLIDGSNGKKDENKASYKQLSSQNDEEWRRWSTQDGHDYHLLDINGNPRKDSFNYPHMRRAPENGTGGISAVAPLGGEAANSRKRKSHKKKEDTIKAEDCEGYKGTLPLNELLDFISGTSAPLENSGPGDAVSKSDKAKKKHEKNKKDRHSVCSKDKKKGEVLCGINGILETAVSSFSSKALNIPLDSNGDVKPLPSLSPDLLQKSSHEPTLKHFNKVTDASSGLIDCSNSAKVDNPPVLNKQQPQAKGVHEDIESVHSVIKAEDDKIKPEAVNVTSAFIHDTSCVFTSDIKTEESFTEVKKKKKRAGTGNASAFNAAPSATAKASFTGSFHHSSRFRHNNSQATSNSVSVMRSLVVGSQTRSPRDLSPSSFPALTGAPPRMDVRRNSCDGISTVSLDIINDSDIESVKSLPVTHCSRALGELSPVYMVSYATMVAAPPKCDNANSSESSVVSASLSSAHTSSSSQLYAAACGTPEKKTTVWKGSPRERRHSIGSSPEDKAEADNPTIAQRHRQKSGSQELLCRESSSAMLKSSVVNNLQLQIKQENDASEEKPRASNACLDSEFLNPSSPLNVSSDSLPPFSLGASLPKPVLKYSQTCEGRNCTDSENPYKELSPLQDNKSEHVAVSVVGDSQSHKSNTNASLSEVTKKSNTNNHKSVVFLDRRFSAFPSKNLGITFGFDSDIESTPDSTSQAVYQPPRNVNASQSKPASPPMPVSSHIPPDSRASLASDFRVSSCNDNSQDLKAGLVQSRCNGLILPGANRKDECFGDKTVCDNRTKSCETKEASLSQPLVVKSNSSQSTETPSSNIAPSCNIPSPIGSARVIFSPNHPPPSYCQGASTLAAPPTSNVCLNSAASTGHSDVCQKVSALQETDLAPEIVNSSIPVIYGLKINPNKGCGKLMFIPPNNKLGVSSSAVCSFLKKQWLQVNNKEKTNPGAFVSCEEDEENTAKS